MEEQRQRQEDEQRRAQAASADDAGGAATTAPAVAATSDETMLERVLAISETPVKRHRVRFYSIFKFFFLCFGFWFVPRTHTEKFISLLPL